MLCEFCSLSSKVETSFGVSGLSLSPDSPSTGAAHEGTPGAEPDQPLASFTCSPRRELENELVLLSRPGWRRREPSQEGQ